MSSYLVTGALGCIGAWTVTKLVKSGHRVVAADLASDRSRLRLASGGTQIEGEVTFIRADVTDIDAMERLVATHRVQRIIHLAAFQVPASHANPPLGALVNVVGTANMLEVARRRSVETVTYASSVAVYGPDLLDVGEPIMTDAPQNPSSFYGIFKCANESMAQKYHEHYGVQSVGLRPHTVYGAGRDTGLTSAPTFAILASAQNTDFKIPFSGRVALQYAPDVAEIFLRASEVRGRGRAYSIRGIVTDMSDLATLLNRRTTGRHVTVSGDPLPFPSDLDDAGLVELIGVVPNTQLERGIDATLRLFRSIPSDLLPNLSQTRGAS